MASQAPGGHTNYCSSPVLVHTNLLLQSGTPVSIPVVSQALGAHALLRQSGTGAHPLLAATPACSMRMRMRGRAGDSGGCPPATHGIGEVAMKRALEVGVGMPLLL